jgi:single-strand DNA-binding protein
MNGVNIVLLVGHAGQDPEIRTTATGSSVCKLNLATNRRVKRGDAWVEETDWHRIELWGRTAEVASQYVKKGRAIGVEGELRTDAWTDKDGASRKSVYVRAHRLHLLGRPDAGARTPMPAVTDADPGGEASVPF